MSSWFSCLTESCLEDRRAEANPQYGRLAAQEIQMIQGRYPQSQPTIHPEALSSPIQQAYQPQTVPVMSAKVAASEIKTSSTPPANLASIIKDNPPKKQLPVRDNLEDSIIYGKFDSLLNDFHSSQVDTNASLSQTKPQQLIAPIENIKPSLAQFQATYANMYMGPQQLQPVRPMHQPIQMYSPRVVNNVYPQVVRRF